MTIDDPGVVTAGQTDATGQAEYRIEFVIQRQTSADADFVEVGFGSSGAWHSVDQAAHMAQSAIANREWETEPGMPDPSEVSA